MRRMKPGSYVINLGRGGQVDEAALIKLLEEEHLAGAALDVFDREPLPEGDPLGGAKPDHHAACRRRLPGLHGWHQPVFSRRMSALSKLESR